MVQKNSSRKPKVKVSIWGKIKRLPIKYQIAIGAIIIPALITVLIKCIEKIPDWLEQPPPEFVIENKSCNPNFANLIVRANNGAARKNKPLYFHIDDFIFEIAQPIKKDNNLYWYISLPDIDLPAPVRTEGLHQVCFGFEQNKMSIFQKINFDTKKPQPIKISIEGNSPQDKRIFGEIYDEAPIDSQIISVDLTFKYGDKLHTIPIESKIITDEDGRQYREFEYQLQNIPQYSPDDSLYEKPFFYLEIKDAAGNITTQKSTYNKFIAPGAVEYGNEMAQILIQQMKGDTPETQRMTIKIPQTTQSKTENLASGPKLITLRVVIRTPHYALLTWNHLPENLRQQPQAYTIRRGGKPIGTSYDTTFTDQTVDSTTLYSYQVQAKGRNNLTYLSNEATAKKPEMQRPLRSTPTTLDSTQVKLMLQSKRFFDSDWNTTALGWQNQFVVQTIQGDKVVMDRSTSLMWLQGGSPNLLYWKNVQTWIDDLNRKGYAGYHDWRLPTLEEAMSLMEPKELNGDLYIDPVYDKTQRWIWTADQVAGGSLRWVVYFSSGDCDGLSINYSTHVRLVRSGLSSTGE